MKELRKSVHSMNVFELVPSYVLNLDCTSMLEGNFGYLGYHFISFHFKFCQCKTVLQGAVLKTYKIDNTLLK